MKIPANLRFAYERARLDLLDQRCARGHWIGELSTSALATATAVSALTLVDSLAAGRRDLIDGGLRWLADHQNDDGGWGDTDKSFSNIATTMLVVAAFHLAQDADAHPAMLDRARRYIDAKDGIRGLRRRYGQDKTFAVPILTNYAIAGLVDWREVAPLPFEAACVPQRFYRWLQLPVVSYAIPALVAIGQARYFHQPPLNPLRRWIRRASVRTSLAVLERMQPASGGYLEAVPLTSFVVMGLASTGRADHPVVTRGVEFLVASVRPDGSWPIDTNLATWNTTLAINALASGGEDVAQVLQPGCLDWLLSCQYTDVHPFTGTRPGGWGWSDLSGAVPDADDTPGALLALAEWHDSPTCSDETRRQIAAAAGAGIDWLLSLQNRDGGWPTFCRGWGKLPFDRSGADLTAHALRAIWRWGNSRSRAFATGFRYLKRQQRPDGSWLPLWFGNQDHPEEFNPVYGTAKVLLAYRDTEQIATAQARSGLQWLAAAQNADGGWGSSVEETALAVEALLAAADDRAFQGAIAKGLEWLCCKVELNQHRESSPIGFYFAKLWYYEKLYPLTFAVSALGRAIQTSHLRPGEQPPATLLDNAPTTNA